MTDPTNAPDQPFTLFQDGPLGRIRAGSLTVTAEDLRTDWEAI
jgi:hypothetical protein